jgi:hypothetical protein
LTLEEALELTALIARKEPQRLARVAAHWLRRYLEETPPRQSARPRSPQRCSALSAPVLTPRGCSRFAPWPKERLGAGDLEA